jgi:4a-hydroxytetrahydrobiopterin dehydratase
MSELEKKHCKPCEAGTAPLQADAVKTMLEKVTDWSLNSESKEISRRFRFKNYYETMAFVNAAAWIAHQEDHHPDMEVGYNRCHIRYSTHAIGGLSENDFICAAKINTLLSDTQNT